MSGVGLVGWVVGRVSVMALLGTVLVTVLGTVWHWFCTCSVPAPALAWPVYGPVNSSVYALVPLWSVRVFQVHPATLPTPGTPTPPPVPGVSRVLQSTAAG